MFKLSMVFAVGLYLGAGVFAGYSMKKVASDLNVTELSQLGVAYIAITWPAQVWCGKESNICTVEPPAAMRPYLFSN